MAPDVPSRFGQHQFPCSARDLVPATGKSAVDREQRLKCVLLGDGAVGKTSLVVSYTTNGYPTEYVPTAFDNYTVRINVGHQPTRLQMCDTAGQDDFDNMRPLCYPGTDVILLCFSVVRPTSLCNVKDKWFPEIRKYLPKVPIVLVGTQTDLRSNVDVLVDLARCNKRPITEEEGGIFAEECNATHYVECSALTQKNLKEVFDTAIMEAKEFKDNKERKRKRSWRKKRPLSSEQTQWKAMQVRRKSVVWWKKVFCFA